MQAIPILCTYKSNRLSYILDWLFTEIFSVPYEIYSAEKIVQEDTLAINYTTEASITSDKQFKILNTGFLSEKEVRNKSSFEHEYYFTTHNTIASNDFAQTDLFSILFFHITRYEEYWATTPDKHGRYKAEDSILFKNNLLELPYLDLLIQDFRQQIELFFNIRLPAKSFRYIATYDIDIAYSYLGKGLTRNLSGLAKSLLQGNITAAAERLQVLFKTKKDPYDAYAYITELHRQLGIPAIYFILSATRTTDFDKNLALNSPEMRHLLQQLSQDGTLGLHPSYYSLCNSKMWLEEKHNLERNSNTRVHISRQHFIKQNIPQTYSFLEAAGITDEYSMGYAGHLGFRAGTSNSFLWYNLPEERCSALRIHPFCFMDATAHYYLKLDADHAFRALHTMKEAIKNIQGTCITVFHNFSLGTDKEWKDWPRYYKTFLEQL